MKSSFSGNILLQGIWEAELLKLKTYVSVKLNSQLVAMAVVTVFRQHMLLLATHYVFKQSNATIGFNNACSFNTTSIPSNQHLTPRTGTIKIIAQVQVKYQISFGITCSVCSCKHAEATAMPVSATRTVQRGKPSHRGSALERPWRGALLSLLASGSNFSIGATNKRTPLS